MSPDSALELARECASNLVATLAETLGSLDRIEHLLKLKLTLPEGLNAETRELVGRVAADRLSDALGPSRDTHERTVSEVVALPAGVLVEAEAMIRVRVETLP